MKGPNLLNKQIGKYTILNEISRGGMGVIFLAKHSSIDRYAAVKMLFPHLAGESNFVKRFGEEMNAMSKLKHPNIVDIYDYEEAFDTYFIVMEVVVGRSLASLLKESGVIPVDSAIGIISQVLEALDCAHKRNILHRDIKPSNIMIDNNGNVKVLDFGISKIIGGENLTQTGFMVGTPQYLSPEQAQGSIVKHSSDLYSLSVMFYEMLCGQLPFAAETPVGFVMCHIKDAPTPLRKKNPNIPVNIEKFIMKGLEKDPSKRFQSAQEMLSSLNQLIGTDKELQTSQSRKSVKKTVIPFEPTSFLEHDAADPQSGFEKRRMSKKLREFFLRMTSATSSLFTLFSFGLSSKLIFNLLIVIVILGGGLALVLTDAGTRLLDRLVAAMPSRTTNEPSTQTEQFVRETMPISKNDQLLTPNLFGIELQEIKEGSFLMGAKPGTTGALDDTPEHEITLDGFFMSRCEITNRQYEMFVRDVSYLPPSHWQDKLCPVKLLDHPVTNVNWYDATTFCAWLSAKTGLNIRLPTEAEWEKACRGESEYPWGGSWIKSAANVSESQLSDTASVGKFEKDRSPSGIYDAGGNVREWIQDYYSMSYYSTSPSKNPRGPEAGEKRVIRGGSFSQMSTSARLTRRDAISSDQKLPDVGFRIVLAN